LPQNSTQIQPACAVDAAATSEPAARAEMMSFFMVVLLMRFGGCWACRWRRSVLAGRQLEIGRLLDGLVRRGEGKAGEGDGGGQRRDDDFVMVVFLRRFEGCWACRWRRSVLASRQREVRRFLDLLQRSKPGSLAKHPR
jgi:hypothetical protein